MLELIGLAYSPWTEKARWALDHHRVEYRYAEHLPMLGEQLLRWKLRRSTGKVTVPALVTEAGALVDSLDIAEYAEREGSGSALFPPPKRDDIEAWNGHSERALAAGRGLVVARTARSRGAKEEALPALIPGALRPALTGMAALGLAFFRFKYKLDAAGEDERRAAIAGELRALRAALGGRAHLLGELTYADIAMSVVVQLVQPVDARYVPLKEATREVWGDPALAAEFGDLIAWRDELYAKHRARS
jgi:glutathione S-transferase